MNSYMFDVNLIILVIDRYFEALKLSLGEKSYFASSYQYKQIERLQDIPKKKELLKIFNLAEDMTQEFYEPTLSILNNKEKKPSHTHDAYIIEICRHRGYTFVSDEILLAETAWKYGGRVKSLREFLKAIRCDDYKNLAY